MEKAATRFWQEREDYHELAQQYDEHTVVNHPKHLSGRSPRGIGGCNCSYCATRVKYPEYNGPRVTPK